MNMENEKHPLLDTEGASENVVADQATSQSTAMDSAFQLAGDDWEVPHSDTIDWSELARIAMNAPDAPTAITAPVEPSWKERSISRIGDALEKAGVVLPDGGVSNESPLILELATLNKVRDSISSADAPVFEELVSDGVFGEHKAYDPGLIEQARLGLKHLKARDLALEMYQQEKTSQVQVNESNPRLIAGDAIFDEPDIPASVWGTGTKSLWTAGQGVMIASQQGLGKTTLAQQVVLHRIGARAGRFLGHDVEYTGKAVLYLAMDRPQQAMGSFKRMVDKGDDQQVQALRERLIIWKGPLPFDAVAETNAFADWIQRVAEERGLEIGDVIVDSVKDMAGGRSLSQDDTGGGLNSAWQEVLARGMDLLLLHHQRKASNGSERMNTLDDVFGSTLLTSGMGSVFALSGQSGGKVVDLIHLKQPLDPVELKISHDHSSGTSTVHKASGQDHSVEALLVQRGAEGVTVAELAEAVYGQSTETTRKRVSRELKELADAHRARRESGKSGAGGKTPDRWFVRNLSNLL